MTSPEWEAANEDDSDRFPQTSHASASESTESHEQGSRVVPDPARVARYAEAIAAQQLSDHPHGFRDVAAAVVAVADEDRAALVAEVERLRNASKQNAVQASRADRRADRLEARAAAAEAEVERLWERLTSERSDVEGLLRVAAEHAAEVVSGELGPRYLDERLRADREEARAEAAEAKVARVEALLALRESNNIRDEEGFVVVRADDVRAMIHPGPDHSCESNGEGTCRHCGADEPPPWPTRAVLADAPVEQRAEGGAWVHQADGSECPEHFPYGHRFSTRLTAEDGSPWWCTTHQSHINWVPAEGDGRG